MSNVIRLDVNEAYEIVYELNGGINHNLNPVKYATGSRYIFLRDAARKGHEFTGWYLDAGLTEKVEGKWLDISQMNGPLKLYAGWRAISDDSDKPADTDGPANGDKPVSGDPGSQTGDNFNVAVPLVLMLCAIAAGMAALLKRRKK